MTIRQCKIYGWTNNATGTIEMNGIEVFNGDFVQNGSYIAQVSVDVDNALAVDNNISVPTTITLTSGFAAFGLASWNYAPINNPAYTEEQMAILNNPASTHADLIAVFGLIANPPFSAEDEAFLLSTDPADSVAQIALIASHNALPQLQSASTFSTSPFATDSQCNRQNVLIDGSPVAGSDTNNLLNLASGQIMTLTNIVFRSNINPPTA